MNNKKISIVTVNWWADDFLVLLRKKVKNLCSNPNSPDIRVVELNNHKGKQNLGHGAGLDYAIKELAIGSDYILVLDVDTHLLMQDWDKKLIEEFNKDDRVKLMACHGGNMKPVRPCGMFFERKFFIENKMSFKSREFDGFTFDVGVHFYFRTLNLAGDNGVKFFEYAKTQYKDVIGCEYTLNGERFLYHNFYGTRWYGLGGEVKHTKIDNVFYADFIKAKNNLFNQA